MLDLQASPLEMPAGIIAVVGIENKHGTGHLVGIKSLTQTLGQLGTEPALLGNRCCCLWPGECVWHQTSQGSVGKSVMRLSSPGRCLVHVSEAAGGGDLGWGSDACTSPHSPPHHHICPSLGRWNGQEEAPCKATLLLARGQLRGVVGVLESRCMWRERGSRIRTHKGKNHPHRQF